MRAIVLAIFFSVLTGCVAQESYSFPSDQRVTAPTPWVAPLSPQQVSALSPEHAKVILLARATIEHRAKSAGSAAPQVLEYRVTDVPEGWEVYVQYVGFWDSGNPHPAPGAFSTVFIDRNWTVRKIVGGA
jgi:hypothetical protein